MTYGLVLYSSDDDDDEESEGASKAEEEGEDGAEKVKQDPDAPPKGSAQKLHEYTPDELARFKQKELIADVELLDGKSIPVVSL